MSDHVSIPTEEEDELERSRRIMRTVGIYAGFALAIAAILFCIYVVPA